jgi:plastocyanin
MRLHRRYLWLVALLSFAGAMAPSIASSVQLPVEAVNEPAVGPYSETHHWSNVPQTVIAGERVTFSNLSTPAVYHGVEWRSTIKPTCEKGEAGEGYVPVGTTPTASATKWSGKCTFSQPGTYTFWCTVHHGEMTGTITVANPGEPVATTGAAESVTETGAVLRGTVNSNGHPTTYYFKYGTTASYGKETSVSSPVEGTNISASAPVSGLTDGTPYHFRLVAKNEKGSVEGVDQTFITPGPPSATTGAATGVSEIEATLKGTVNADGKPTMYFFEWGTSESYGQVTAETPAGAEHFNELASAKLTGLVPGKGYHFRIVAKNASEEVHGLDQMFTTKSLSSPPPEPSPPTPTPTTTTTTTTTTPPQTSPTPTGPPPGPPLTGSPSLRSTQRGTSVKGSIDVSQSGAAGRLEVDLLAKSASLAAAHRSGSARVGRFVRASVSAGTVSFSVALTPRGKSALRRHHQLALAVKITLTPPRGAAVTITRSVTLRS